MDISFLNDEGKFNYRVGAIIINGNKILAMKDERSPYYYLPGGRVMMGERAEDVDGYDYHELCIYFLVDISESDLLQRGERFCLKEGLHIHKFQWLDFEALEDLYFYPLFLKKEIFNLPEEFTIRTEFQ